MVISLKLLFLKFWSFWGGMFDQMPYGDPYIATTALFLLIIFMSTYLFKEHAS